MKVIEATFNWSYFYDQVFPLVDESNTYPSIKDKGYSRGKD